MATIERARLSIDADATGAHPRATLTVTYTVFYDEFDQASHQRYRQTWRIVGVDGEEDNTVQTTPAAEPPVYVSSDGSAREQRELVIVRDLHDLDEDPNGGDEIKVEIHLSPVLPVFLMAMTNRVLVNA